MNQITRDELSHILADMKEMWATLRDIAMTAPGAAATIGTRMELPEVIDMVFEQAGLAPSETGDIPRNLADRLKLMERIVKGCDGQSTRQIVMYTMDILRSQRSEKVESDPLGEEPRHFELARTRMLRKRIADIVATHDAFVADPNNKARAYELRDAVDRARGIGLTKAERAIEQDYDCPHAAPHRYCAVCKVDPCPLGFKHKDHRSNERT